LLTGYRRAFPSSPSVSW